mgnify:CR=1 FL=1
MPQKKNYPLLERVRGRSALSRCSSRSTSTWDSGTGLLDAPTKPVTRAVRVLPVSEGDQFAIALVVFAMGTVACADHDPSGSSGSQMESGSSRRSTPWSTRRPSEAPTS